MSKWNRVHFRRHLACPVWGSSVPPGRVHNHYPFHRFWDGGYFSLRLSLQVLLVSVLIASGSLAQWEDCWRLYKRGDAEEKCKLENANCKMSGILRLLRSWSLLFEFCTRPLYWASDMDRDLVPFTVNDLRLLLEAISGEEFITAGSIDTFPSSGLPQGFGTPPEIMTPEPSSNATLGSGEKIWLHTRGSNIFDPGSGPVSWSKKVRASQIMQTLDPGRVLRHHILGGGFGLPPTSTYQLLVVGVSREGDMWGQGSKIYSSEPAICYEPLAISQSDATLSAGPEDSSKFFEGSGRVIIVDWKTLPQILTNPLTVVSIHLSNLQGGGYGKVCC